MMLQQDVAERLQGVQ